MVFSTGPDAKGIETAPGIVELTAQIPFSTGPDAKGIETVCNACMSARHAQGSALALTQKGLRRFLVLIVAEVDRSALALTQKGLRLPDPIPLLVAEPFSSSPEEKGIETWWRQGYVLPAIRFNSARW